ncbi:PTTG1 interacting protein b [Esox lucius]|uniref:PTTG1 interacting protein b n=1 Tax=Esox lucius TaxID=8010 RepID=UPI0014769417|nr:PTTG1 interacting protein b [Esox lucius]
MSGDDLPTVVRGQRRLSRLVRNDGYRLEECVTTQCITPCCVWEGSRRLVGVHDDPSTLEDTHNGLARVNPAVFGLPRQDHPAPQKPVSPTRGSMGTLLGVICTILSYLAEIVNFQALIITLSLIAGVIIIAVMVCCFRCCRSKKTVDTTADAAMERQADARKVRQEERRTEMRLRHDEIRSKYGLTKENPYARFEDN